MPSIASHFVVAKLVSKHLNINSDDFYKGNILPDIIDISNSHVKIKGTYYEIPNIEYISKNINFNNDLELGYFCHLLLDKYFLEEYVLDKVKNYKEIDPFLSKRMYNDYTKINYRLVKYFDLDVSYLNRIMNNIDLSLNDEKVNSNLNSINTKEVFGKLECLDLKSYISFLEDISLRISNELKEKR